MAGKQTFQLTSNLIDRCALESEALRLYPIVTRVRKVSRTKPGPSCLRPVPRWHGSCSPLSQSPEFPWLQKTSFLAFETVMPNVGKVWAPRGLMLSRFSGTMYQYEPTSDQWMELEEVPFSLSLLSEKLIPIAAGVNRLCEFK